MGIGQIVDKGVFLDRDGVINYNVLNRVSGEWESPHSPDDFELFTWTIQSLQRLVENQFKLFLVSNQPSYAKGKTTLANIKAIQDKLHRILVDNRIYFTEYYYCYHHPQGIVPEISFECECRKPGTLFLQEAKSNYDLDMNLSWLIGDRESDIACGKKAGVRTILILNPEGMKSEQNLQSMPEFEAANLLEAVNIITRGS